MAKEILHYAYVNGDTQMAPILMLHGTGSDEIDMLEVAEFFKSGLDNPIISVRARLLEQGHVTRYFQRYDDGDFDLDSLHQEADWLLNTINDLSKQYRLKQEKMVVIGFSNGANIALQAYMDNPKAKFAGIVALHPMLIEKIQKPQDRKGGKVYITHGSKDNIVTEDNFDQLADNLRQTGAEVSVYKDDGVHGLSDQEAQSALIWLSANNLLADNAPIPTHQHDD